MFDNDPKAKEAEIAGFLGVNLADLENADAGGARAVRPGDASVAAPFTSRMSTVRAVVNLIRQGRCTLLSALMQQQIMMLECIIQARCVGWNGVVRSGNRVGARLSFASIAQYGPFY